MKMKYYTLLSVCFLILAGFLAYFDKDGYGWCIFGAIIGGVNISDKMKGY